MPPKNKENKEKKDYSTRSRSATRSGGRGVVTAVSPAPSNLLPKPRTSSRSRIDGVPSTNQNKPVNAAVSSTSVSLLDFCNKSNMDGDNQPKASNQTNSGTLSLEFGNQTTPGGHAAALQMGDNKEASIQTDPMPQDVILTYVNSMKSMAEELKTIRVKIDKLDSIEASTSSVANQLKGLTDRTSKVEEAVEENSSKIQRNNVAVESNTSNITHMNSEIDALKETVELQGRAIVKLTTMKADLIKRNKEAVGQVNEIVGTHKEQVLSFQAKTDGLEDNILQQVQEKIDEQKEEVSNDITFQSLKEKAFACRHNLVVMGLGEDTEKTPLEAAKELFKSMGARDLDLHSAYRLGTSRPGSTNYSRPIMVRFNFLPDRNRVWRKRMQFTPEEEGGQRVRIQADLPKALRDETGILYRVRRAAANIGKYSSAIVRNYAIQLHGKEYAPHNLEKLPEPLRPSVISNPRSDSAIAFFSKYSALSNHHYSPFLLNNHNYQNMEHYLAFQKASLTDNQPLIQRAELASDPLEAKAILNSLREDHVDEWTQRVEAVTLDGLRAKFSQNPQLASFLRGTKGLQIGEASKNPRWGIGLDLNDRDVLNISKWDINGNLLGKCLMKIREEIYSLPPGE